MEHTPSKDYSYSIEERIIGALQEVRPYLQEDGGDVEFVRFEVETQVAEIRMLGAWAGSWMAGARLCRCHPGGGAGWDPAPTALRKASWWRPWRYGDWKGGYRAPPNDVESDKRKS